MPTIIYQDETIEEVDLAGFDESLHPRAPKGSETGGEWTRLTANPAPPESIEKFRDDHWKSTKETAVILQNGKPVKTVGQNKKYNVEFSNEDEYLMNNGTMIHNHPGGSALSHTDIALASRVNLESIEAFGSDWYLKENVSWTIERPAAGWPAPDKIKRAYKIYEQAYVIRAREKMKTEGWDSYQAAHWATNEILTRTFDNLGLKMVRNVYP